jgi:hypothetical protein
MKTKIYLTFIFLIIGVANIFSQIVTVEKMPTTIEDFLSLRDKIAQEPEGGATIFLLAFKIYAENHELGKQCLVIAADMGSLREGDVYKGYALLNQDMLLIDKQLGHDINIPNSYIKGSSPKESYKVKLPYVYEYSSNAYCGNPKTGTYKLFVKCSGADSPRPIGLHRNDKGIWKATTWSSVLVGIKKAPVSDDL